MKMFPANKMIHSEHMVQGLFHFSQGSLLKAASRLLIAEVFQQLALLQKWNAENMLVLNPQLGLHPTSSR